MNRETFSSCKVKCFGTCRQKIKNQILRNVFRFSCVFKCFIKLIDLKNFRFFSTFLIWTLYLLRNCPLLYFLFGKIVWLNAYLTVVYYYFLFLVVNTHFIFINQLKKIWPFIFHSWQLQYRFTNMFLWCIKQRIF